MTRRDSAVDDFGVLLTISLSQAPHSVHGVRASARLWALFVLLTLVGLAAPGEATAFTYFTPPGDIWSPLAQGRDGNIYVAGWSAYRMTPGGSFTKLHDFDWGKEGGNPQALTMGTDGNFYLAMMEAGPGLGPDGPGPEWASGTLLKMTPSGTVTLLHSYPSPEGGGQPRQLIVGRDGNLYGTTDVSPIDSVLSLYRLTPSGNYSNFYLFPYEVSGEPYSLTLARDGSFWGTTYGGGIFKVTKSAQGYVMHNFTSGDGSPDAPLVLGLDGNFYGVTSVSLGAPLGNAIGGKLFKITARGELTFLHMFPRNATGYLPERFRLLAASDGNIYGASYLGGTGNCGYLFKITPAGAYSVLSGIDYSKFCHPFHILQHTNGRIYGLDQAGIYELDVGISRFVGMVPDGGKVGSTITLLGAFGNELVGPVSVTFNGVAVRFSTGRNGPYTYLTAVVPPGAATGPIKVTNALGVAQQTARSFLQLPTLSAFSPNTGTVGSSVVLTGTGLTQTTSVTFGGGKLANFAVNTDSQITATVPVGAITGRITVTTKGGSVSTATAFKVTP